MWFPTRIPCPRCAGHSSLGALGWAVYLAINLGGFASCLVALARVAQGDLSVSRALLAGIALMMFAPFVWVAALRAMPSRPTASQNARSRVV